MTGLTKPASANEAAVAEWAEGLRYVARQPILDLRGRLHAYELLFRSGPEIAFRGDGDKATRTILDDTVLFGLEKMTGGAPAFVNCTLEALTDELVDILPAGMTVLEILETVEPSPDLIAGCRRLKAAGYRLALDDFVWAPKFDPLVKLADYIKVDFTLTGPRERKKLFERLRKRPVAMLAEKVETQEDYDQARNEGFTLFQGYFFCRPTLMKNRSIPSNRMHHFQIMQLLQDEDIDLDKASRLMKQDASLTYRLLRLANSLVYASRADISSIREALLTVGEKTFRRFVMLAIASDLNGKQPLEILHMAFVRGRFCELASERCGLNPDEQYLMGLLSMLPAMMLMPMEDLVPALPLREEISVALQGAPNRERVPLGWIECHEQANWATCDAMVEANGLTEEEMVACYRSALAWAGAAIQLTSSTGIASTVRF